MYMEENRQKMNDIIFAHRNKAYGAYAIRSDYGNTVIRSLLIVAGTIGSLAFLAYRVTRPLPDPAILPVGQEKIIECIFPVIEEEKKVEQHDTHKTTEKSGGQKSTQNALVVSDSVETHDTSVVQTNLIATNNSTAVSTETSTGSGTYTTAGFPTSGTTAVVHNEFTLDKMPEFDGGFDALRTYVMRRVKYPREALDDGLEATVYVKFIVDEKGKITDIKALNTPNGGFVESAIDAMKQVPDFKSPGYFQGHAVKCYYQLPIRFKLSR